MTKGSLLVTDNTDCDDIDDDQYARRHRVLWVLTHLGQKRQISVKQKPNDSAISLAIESSDFYSTESDLLLVHVQLV